MPTFTGSSTIGAIHARGGPDDRHTGSELLIIEPSEGNSLSGGAEPRVVPVNYLVEADLLVAVSLGFLIGSAVSPECDSRVFEAVVEIRLRNAHVIGSLEEHMGGGAYVERVILV